MKSPGHEKWPTHHVRERPVRSRVKVEAGGKRVAESRDVLRVDEDNHPARFYFPRKDVSMELLERSETVTTCPFKGVARYYHLRLGDRRVEDVAWTYEDPYDEHRELKGRLAFYDDSLFKMTVGVPLSPSLTLL